MTAITHRGQRLNRYFYRDNHPLAIDLFNVLLTMESFSLIFILNFLLQLSAPTIGPL